MIINNANMKFVGPNKDINEIYGDKFEYYDNFDLIKNLEEKERIIVSGGILLPNDFIEENKEKIQIIMSRGVGVDNLPIELLDKNNILYGNNPEHSQYATIHHGLAFLFEYLKISNNVENFKNINIGIIGSGSIGNGLYGFLNSFLNKTNQYSIYHNGVNGLNDFINDNDVIILTTKLTDLTKNMINNDNIGLFDGKGLINISRSGLIEDENLIERKTINNEMHYLTDVYKGDNGKKSLMKENSHLKITNHEGGRSLNNIENMIKGLKYHIDEILNLNFSNIGNIKQFNFCELEAKDEDIIDFLESLNKIKLGDKHVILDENNNKVLKHFLLLKKQLFRY